MTSKLVYQSFIDTSVDNTINFKGNQNVEILSNNVNDINITVQQDSSTPGVVSNWFFTRPHKKYTLYTVGSYIKPEGCEEEYDPEIILWAENRNKTILTNTKVIPDGFDYEYLSDTINLHSVVIDTDKWHKEEVRVGILSKNPCNNLKINLVVFYVIESDIESPTYIHEGYKPKRTPTIYSPCLTSGHCTIID